MELFRKLPITMGNILWKLEDHSYSRKRAILLQSWHFDIRKNSILCIKRMLVSRYTCIARSVRCDVILYIYISRFLGVMDSPGTVVISDASNIWGVKGHWTSVINVVLANLWSYECRIVLKLIGKIWIQKQNIFAVNDRVKGQIQRSNVNKLWLKMLFSSHMFIQESQLIMKLCQERRRVDYSWGNIPLLSA